MQDCIYCGEIEDAGNGAETFLLGRNQLEERCLTEAYQCRPICIECLKMKHKVVTSDLRGRMN